MPRNLALIGHGKWGKHLARVFDHLGVLEAVCDTPQELDAILTSTIKQVAIATPSHTHFELILMALRANKDVFVEKPMCLNKQQAVYLQKEVQNSKQILMVGHLLRYHPSFLKLQNIVEQGLIGNVKTISAIRFNTQEAKPEGVLLDLAVHDISMALAVRRSSHIANARCHSRGGGNPVWIPGQARDDNIGSIQFKINVGASQAIKQQQFSVIGDKGEIIFDDLKPWHQKLQLNGQYISSPNTEPLEAECRYFLKCCEKRTTPLTDAKESYDVLDFLESSRIIPNFFPHHTHVKISS